MGTLALAALLNILVCWILVMIKILRLKGLGHGILGFTGIYAFVLGCSNYQEWKLTFVMQLWSLSLMVCGYVFFFGHFLSE